MTKHGIALVAARSGGHILPGLTLARSIHQENPSRPLLFFFSKNKLDEHIASQSSLNATHIFVKLENIPYKNPLKLIVFFWHAVTAFFRALVLLRKHAIGKVISMGGYLSIPICLAAWVLRIPIELYELNVTPGKAISFLSLFAQRIHVCFKETAHYLPSKKLELAPYPLKYEQRDKMSSSQAKELIGLSPHKKTILICGGSQGSVSINQLIKQWIELNSHVHSSIQIIHQTGSYDKTNWDLFYQLYRIKAVCFAYHQDMHDYYNAADVVVSRAGAGSLFEIAFFEKPCVVIPLETRATDHQKYNAYAMAHQYPHLFTVVHENHIKKNNTLFFSAISKYLIHTSHSKPVESPTIL